MANFTVLHTDARSLDGIRDEQAELAKIDARIALAKGSGEVDLIEAGRSVDGILNGGAQLTRRVLESLTNCKVIVRYGVGVDTVDLDAATDCGIAVANVPDFCIEEVSNHAIMLVLALSRKLCRLSNMVKAGRWDRSARSPIGKIEGQTLGLVAFGRLARAVATKAKVFGLRVLVYDPYVSTEVARQYGVEPTTLERLLAVSDYVSVHTPLTEQTRHLFDVERFRQMKPGACFVNTSRGPVVDEAALLRALEEGWIAGAALDVFEKEPPDPDNPLFKLDNFIATPHMASYSDAAFADLRLRVAKEVCRVLTGHWPANLVNVDVRSRLSLSD
ncbi:MAG: C-terminal binding protein [Chloroflexi bacterium]|nr:C-terminal binding protein [Chloroflexota bacterium]